MPAIRNNKGSARKESNRPATKRVTRSSSKKAPAVEQKEEAPAVQPKDAEESGPADFITLFLPSDDDGDDDEFAVKKYISRRPWYFYTQHTRLRPQDCPWYATAKEPTYSPTDPLALETPAQ